MSDWSKQQKQTVTRSGGGDRLAKIEVLHRDTRPSWKRYGNGNAHIKIAASAKEDNEWISFTVSETSLDSARPVTKETYFTAYDDKARSIYEYLHEIFGEK